MRNSQFLWLRVRCRQLNLLCMRDNRNHHRTTTPAAVIIACIILCYICSRWYFIQPAVLVAHVSVPLYDLKGSDSRLLQVIESMRKNGASLVYGAWGRDPDEQQHHYDRLHRLHMDVRSPLDLSRLPTVSHALLFFWPTSDYWAWLENLVGVLRNQQPDCSITLLVDELFWERWGVLGKRLGPSVKDDPKFRWIVVQPEAMRLKMTLMAQIVNRVAFITKRDMDTMSRYAPNLLSRSLILPYVAEVKRSMPLGKSDFHGRSGMLFVSFNNVENTASILWFVEHVLTQLHITQPLHIVGSICESLPELRGNSRVVLHGTLSSEALETLMNQVLVAINPVASPGGISTKNINAMSLGLAFAVARSTVRGIDLPSFSRDEKDLPICPATDSQCWTSVLARLLVDADYWSAVSAYSLRIVSEQFASSLLDRATKDWLDGREVMQSSSPVLYVALVIRNVEPIWSLLEPELLSFLRRQPNIQHSFVSVVSSGNTDGTDILLKAFASKLIGMNVHHAIEIESEGDRSQYSTDRAEFLAQLRNRALKHLNGRHTHIMFLNDIIANAKHMEILLHTAFDYDMVCAMDFSVAKFSLQQNHRVVDRPESGLRFYDIWVTRDLQGNLFTSEFPWAVRAVDRKFVLGGSPFRVKSCWNGMVVMKARPFLTEGLRFRSSQASERCYASECELLCNDLWALGHRQIVINPIVITAYSQEVYSAARATPYARKFEHWSPATQAAAFHHLSGQLTTTDTEQFWTIQTPPDSVCCNNDVLHDAFWGQCYWQPVQPHRAVLLRGPVQDRVSFSELNRVLIKTITSPAFSRNPVNVRVLSTDRESLALTSYMSPEEIETLRFILPGGEAQGGLVISSGWPPMWKVDKCVLCKHVLWQPWEYGSIPHEWVSLMNTVYDEVWVPTHFLKQDYIADGVKPHKLRVIPNVVDPLYFDADDVSTVLPASLHAALNGVRSATTRFLFFGGLLMRKGIDVLLRAYADAFSDRDDVVLVILSSYSHGFDTSPLKNWSSRKPALIWLHQLNLAREELITLMKWADYLVAPYRSEGFGMTILQALAVGLPVMVTDSGASMDYAFESTATLIPSELRPCTEYPCDVSSSVPKVCVFQDVAGGPVSCRPTVRPPFWAEPSVSALTQLLRDAPANRATARVKAAAAQKFVRRRFSPAAFAELFASVYDSLVTS